MRYGFLVAAMLLAASRPIDQKPKSLGPLTISDCIDLLNLQDTYSQEFTGDPIPKWIPLRYARPLAQLCWGDKVVFVEQQGLDEWNAGDYIKMQAGGFTASGQNSFALALNVRLGTIKAKAFYTKKIGDEWMVDIYEPYHWHALTWNDLAYSWSDFIGDFPQGIFNPKRLSFVVNFAVGRRAGGVGTNPNPARVLVGIGYNLNPHMVIGYGVFFPSQPIDSLRDLDFGAFISMDWNGVYEPLLLGFTADVAKAVGNVIDEIF